MLSWNCRGLGAPRTIQFLQELVLRKRPNFIFLCETLCKKVKVEKIRSLLGFEGLVVVEPRGHSGGLVFLWRFKEEAQLLSFSQNHIDLLLSPKNCPIFRLSGMYGEPDRLKREYTWNLIRRLESSSPSHPWCIIRDLNNILSQSDKKGG